MLLHTTASRPSCSTCTCSCRILIWSLRRSSRGLGSHSSKAQSPGCRHPRGFALPANTRGESEMDSNDPSERAAAALLSVADPNYTFPNTPSHSNRYPTLPDQWPFIPSLSDLLDCLIDKLLDAPVDDYMLKWHLARQIGSLYGYVPILQEREFAEHLKPENCQHHFDTVSGMSTGTEPFTRHERRTRDAIREGNYTLQECSANRDDEELFPGKAEARVLATLPRPSRKVNREQ